MGKTYWHFAKVENGKPVMRDGTPIEIGRRYTVPEAVICKSGFHGSSLVIDALVYAPGPWVSRRQINDEIISGDKVCGTSCVHIAGFDATEVLRKFARMCALDVIHLWNAPEVVVRYLKTGDETIRSEARNAARNATREAARDAVAAWDAAAAARDAVAARKRQNRRLTRMLNEAMREADRG